VFPTFTPAFINADSCMEVKSRIPVLSGAMYSSYAGTLYRDYFTFIIISGAPLAESVTLAVLSYCESLASTVIFTYCFPSPIVCELLHQLSEVLICHSAGPSI